MVGTETQEVERKVLAILRIVGDSAEPMGARLIARRLKDYGIDLTERAVRYHLKLMDERGLTRLVGRDGRVITEQGREEMRSALVQDKVGLVLSRIEMLAFQTNFDFRTCTGTIPVNISFFPKDKFARAKTLMAPAFKAGLCAGDRVAVAGEGERIGEHVVPQGKVGLATVCSVLVNGVLLKAGVPMDSRFGGILQIRNYKPLRFVELIYYAGTSLDPSEVFIRGKMTSVRKAAGQGNGKILANFREVPAPCRSIVDEVISRMNEVGLGAILTTGNTSEPLCQIPVDLNKVGMILVGGMNPIAAAEEGGIEADNRAGSTVVDYGSLVKFDDLRV